MYFYTKNIIQIISWIQHAPSAAGSLWFQEIQGFSQEIQLHFNDIYPALIHNRCIQARGIDDCYNLVLKFVGYFVIYFKHKAWNVFPNYEMYGDL